MAICSHTPRRVEKTEVWGREAELSVTLEGALVGVPDVPSVFHDTHCCICLQQLSATAVQFPRTVTSGLTYTLTDEAVEGGFSPEDGKLILWADA